MTSPQSSLCPKCGGAMKAGFAVSAPHITEQANVMFRVPGSPTSRNPIKAFMQGLKSEEPAFYDYYIKGLRCSTCGYLELYATDSKKLWDGRCPKCSYDLRASTDRCPECGTSIPRTRV